MAMQKDILALQKKRLGKFGAKFNQAVSAITNAIDQLEEINRGIDDTVTEIEAYESELAITRVSLSETKTRNERVISNFGALLNID